MKTAKSYIPKKIERQWVEIDASAKPVGRVATAIANRLRGKHRRDFTPHIDGGDFVVAINVDKLVFSGRKVDQKKYHHYSGYPGGIRTKELKHMLLEHSDDVLRRAVFSMIDDFKLRKPMMRRLKLVKGATHEFKIDKKI